MWAEKSSSGLSATFFHVFTAAYQSLVENGEICFYGFHITTAFFLQHIHNVKFVDTVGSLN